MRCSASIALAAVVIAGCHASVHGHVSASGEQQGEASSGGPEPSSAESPAAASAPSAPESETMIAASGPQALLGARHDLRLAASRKTATCSCLAVAVGQPNSSAFAWELTPPVIDPDTQLVIALSSEGIACSQHPKDSLGASYWGYRTRHGNVIVEVEAARFGRPVTSGAIIPRPVDGAHVYVRPTNRSVPYGRPLDRSRGDCKVF